MFEELYAPLPDRERYLRRIGITEICNPDRNYLDSLIRAHQRSVPFENLDICDADRDILLGIPSLFDKIVVRRRGGYCFELNAAFMSLLISLGFFCSPVAARVIWMRNIGAHSPLSHRAAIVTIGGERLFCDVGFGGPSPQRSLNLDSTDEQKSGEYIFTFDKVGDSYILSFKIGGEKQPVLQFSDRPVDPIDFLPLSEYQSKNRDSKFRQERIVNLITEDGNISLGGNTLRIRKGDETEEKCLESESEIISSMKEYFGLAVDFPLKM